MDYELLEKMKVEELKNYLKIHDLKKQGQKKQLVERVLAASENGVQPVKTVIEIESDLITDYKKKKKDLSDHKNSKVSSYYKSGWLQPLQYNNLSGSKYCIIRGECRKSQSIKDPFHKLWIILEKTAKIRTCH